MSKDIRSFFTMGAKKPAAAVVPASPVIKRKAPRISSDEEEIPETPQNKKTKEVRSKKKRRVDDDSDDECTEVEVLPSKKPNLSKLNRKEPVAKKDLKKVDASSMFGGEPTRVERKKLPKKEKADDSLHLESDDDFEQSLMELDESELMVKSPVKNVAAKTSPTETTVSSNTTISTPKSNKQKLNSAVLESPVVSKKPKPRTPKTPDLEKSVLSDEERFERKRMSAILYQKFKNRSTGPTNPGSKEIPKGKPNCLAGLTFLVTGVLESTERDEANQIIKDLGGKISTTVGKRLNYLVAGEDSGPKKLADAEQLGIKILTEDDLFNLIREKSGEKVNNNTAVKSSPPIKSPPKESKIRKVKEEIATPSKLQKVKEEIVTPKAKVEAVTQVVKKEKAETVKIETQFKSETKPPIDTNMLAWVDKYKPTELKQIIGQQGAASNCTKLLNWLTKWYANHDGKKKLQKPNPWAKNDDGSFYKAALLSGPPGVGKTTTATLVCKELGFDTVEFNASDTRSKRLLKEEVSELLSNKSLYGYFHGSSHAVTKKHVLIMDEVDGMAGNEDRGGIQELISLIKDASVPIICMCNDRNHQKMRSLVNYCYDLRFNKPRLEMIKGPIMSICFKENIKLPPAKIAEIIEATNNDIRQTLNHLSLLSAGKDLKLSKEPATDSTARKDLKLGPWEVVRKVFSADEHKSMSLNDKSDLFFNDYSLGPLFVQQNYLIVAPKVKDHLVPLQVALTADSLSLGDMVDKRIRSNSAWTLLPTLAMYSSVLPGEYMSGYIKGQINFPGWLGKNSKTTKRSRLAQEIHNHTRVSTSGSRKSIRLDYAPFLLDAIVRPLKNKGAEGVEDALAVIKEYRLLREDIESLVELNTWPGKKNPMDSVDGKVKAALTRAYNKEVLAYTYSAAAGVKKKVSDTTENDLLDNEEESAALGDTDDEVDDKVENDALIKAKKKPAAKSKATDTKKPSTSKAKASTSKSKK